jgi:periplasmic divalent cation tolerance protein
MKNFIQVIVSVPSKAVATKIAEHLLEERLAACVQIIDPIKSMYWWHGDIETADELLCLIKTRSDLFTEIESSIKQLHPYDVPEIIAIPIESGSEDYLDWITESVRNVQF